MRRLSSLCLLLLACCTFGPALAQDKKSSGETAKKEDARPREAEIKFADGSVLRVLILDNVEVATRFGKLNISAADLRRIDFGLHVTDEMTRKIDDAIARLGSDTFQKREDAGKELLVLGAAAVPALKEAAKSADQEVALRARTVLDRVREKVPAAQLNLKATDSIVSNDFPIVGRVLNPTFKVRTAYFGDQEVKTADLRAIRWTGGAEGEIEVTVDAAKHGVDDTAWFDTGCSVEWGAVLTLSAAGQADMLPQQQPGRFVSGPLGRRDLLGNQPLSIQTPGALIAKVGEGGEAFVVGAKLEKTVNAEGNVFLRIVHFAENVPTGAYKVKIGGAHKAGE